jgi:DNA-binding response OmpR family regulator
MAQRTVVLICPDVERAEWVRQSLAAVGVDDVERFPRAEDLGDVLGDTGHGLMLYYRMDGEGLSGIDAALWSQTTSDRGAPLIVLSDRYEASEALTLFQMGVTDYLGVREHQDHFARLTARLLGVKDEPWFRTARTVRDREGAEAFEGVESLAR